MKSLLSVISIVSLIVAIAACDVIEAPYLKNPVVPTDTTKLDTSTVKAASNGLQNVLLEDYTGHTCGNCPEAAVIAKDIEKKNPGRVIVMAVHVGTFAVPEFPLYPADYRTSVGNTLDETFLNSRAGLPNGLVNRVRYNNRLVLGRQNWEPAVAAQLALTPKVDVSLGHTFYAEDSTIVATAEVNYLQEGEDDYAIVVYLVENGIIGDQKDYSKNPEHIEDYEFDHMLRASLNGTWGDSLSKVKQPAGSTVSKTIRYRIPSTVSWNLDRCELIAYVIRRKDAATRDVLQVVKKPLR